MVRDVIYDLSRWKLKSEWSSSSSFGGTPRCDFSSTPWPTPECSEGLLPALDPLWGLGKGRGTTPVAGEAVAVRARVGAAVLGSPGL